MREFPRWHVCVVVFDSFFCALQPNSLARFKPDARCSWKDFRITSVMRRCSRRLQRREATIAFSGCTPPAAL
ncbi:hypothetical protein, partial [Stenotrophomonas maltophilia]